MRPSVGRKIGSSTPKQRQDVDASGTFPTSILEGAFKATTPACLATVHSSHDRSQDANAGENGALVRRVVSAADSARSHRVQLDVLLHPCDCQHPHDGSCRPVMDSLVPQEDCRVYPRAQNSYRKNTVSQAAAPCTASRRWNRGEKRHGKRVPHLQHPGPRRLPLRPRRHLVAPPLLKAPHLLEFGVFFILRLRMAANRHNGLSHGTIAFTAQTHPEVRSTGSD